ncbi:hypothetical protein [Paraburkholderia sp. BR14374]|uniref:hypothetical protein n=1 Tax=Paraburkholderia sp. BR14374 TaxID=3237007 RepID=UPI0034CFA009
MLFSTSNRAGRGLKQLAFTLRRVSHWSFVTVMNDSAPSPELVRRLARYLRVNPLACDTEEGIGKWWLGLDPPSLVELSNALRWLVTIGVVEAARAADGRVRYRRVALTAAIDARLDQLIERTP